MASSILPSFVSRSLTNGFDLARNTIGGLTWGPALAVAKPAILSVFSQIETGTLLLVDEPASTRMVYGESIGNGNNNTKANTTHNTNNTKIKRNSFTKTNHSTKDTKNNYTTNNYTTHYTQT